jgi:uncharacterized repeat protein (TIGR01451 family)
MPKLFSISLSISVLPSIRYDQSFKSSSRPARLILAVLGGCVLMGLWLFVIAKMQSSAQAAPTFQFCNAGPAVIARTHSSTGTPHNNIIAATSDPLCIKTDLRVAKTGNNATPQVGETITYTVVVTNGGPDDATGAQLTDVLPESVTFGSVTPQDSCTETDGAVICDLGSLPNDATATVTIVVTPTNAGMITNMASVTGNESDPDPGNNTAKKSVRVVGADLVVTKTVNITAPKAGDVITYTITAANNGPDNATGVQVIDALPAGVTFSGYTATQGTYTSATGLWDLKDDLPDGAIATLTITATVNSCTGYTTIMNAVTVTAGQPTDPNLDNNRASAVITPTSVAHCLFLPIILKPPPPPCYVETFDDPNSSWHFDSLPGPPTLLEYLNGRYHMFTQDTSVSHWARSRRGSYFDYTVQVDVLWANPTHTGEGHGIVFGMSGTKSKLKYYRFNINADTEVGTYVLDKIEGNSRIRLVSAKSQDIFTGTVTNTLTADYDGYTLDLYINGKHQTTCPDIDSCPDFGSPLPRPGYMGVDIVPYDHVNGEAYFDNFTICSYELIEGGMNVLEVVPHSSGIGSK